MEEMRRLKGVLDGMVRDQQGLRNGARTGSPEYVTACDKLDALWMVMAQMRIIVTGSNTARWPDGWDD